MIFGGSIDGAGSFGGGASLGGDPSSDGATYGDSMLDDRQALHFVMIEGLPRIWMTSVPSNWTAPSGRTFTPGLQHPGRYTQSITTLAAVADEQIPDLVIDEGTTGVVTAALAVSSSGDWYADLLGGPTAFSSIMPTDTTVSVKQLMGVIPASGEGYLGLECVSYSLTTTSQGLPGLTLVRGLYPAFGDERGRMHMVDAARLQYPRVGSRATTHVGRFVAMYEVGYNTRGAVMPMTSARILWTGVLGAPSHSGNTYKFPVTSVPQYLRGGGSKVGARGALHAQPFKAQVGASSAGGAPVGVWCVDRPGTNGALTTSGTVVIASIGNDQVAGQFSRLTVDLLNDVITPNTAAKAAMPPSQRLVAALNTALNTASGGGVGTWRAVLDGTNRVQITWQVGSVPVDPDRPPTITFWNRDPLAWLLGFTGGAQVKYGTQDVTEVTLAFDAGNANASVFSDVAPVETLVYLASIGTTGQTAVSLSVAPSTATGVLATQTDVPITAAGAARPYCFLLVDGQFVLGGAPPTLSTWSPQTTSLTFTCDRRVDNVDGTPLGNGTLQAALPAYRRLGDPKPLLVEQVWVPLGSGVDSSPGFGSDAFGALIDPSEFLLRSALSTGSIGSNSATYDTSPAMWGVGLPSSLVDIDSFRTLRSREAATLGRRYIFRGPVAFMDLVDEELRFLGARLTMRSGRMTVSSPTLPTAPGRTRSLSTANLVPTLDASNNGSTDRPTHDRGSSMVVNAASVEVDYDVITGKYLPPTIELSIASSLGETGTVGKIELRSRGVTRARMGEAPLRQAIASVIASAWARYAREAQIVTRGINWSLRRLTAGDQVLLTEQSVPSMYTGLLGLTAAPAEVLRASFDYESRQGEVELYLYPLGSTAQGGYTMTDIADSAVLDVAAAGKGYDSGTLTLTIAAERAPTVAGARVPFVAGDAIVVRNLDPADPTAPQQWSTTVVSVSQTAGTIVIDSALTGFLTTAGVRYCVEPAAYSSCSTAQKAAMTFLSDADTLAIAATAGLVRCLG